MALSEMLLTMTPFTTDWEEDVDPAEARALQPIMIERSPAHTDAENNLPAEARALQPIMIERSPAHTDAENNLLFIICIYPFLLFPI